MNMDKLSGLLRRAVHPGTPVEEARTCALMVAKEVARRELLSILDVSDKLAERVVQLEHELKQAKRSTARNTPDDGRPMKRPVPIKSKLGGTCRVCGESFFVGSSIWWKKGEGCAHRECGWPA